MKKHHLIVRLKKITVQIFQFCFYLFSYLMPNTLIFSSEMLIISFSKTIGFLKCLLNLISIFIIKNFFFLSDTWEDHGEIEEGKK